MLESRQQSSLCGQQQRRSYPTGGIAANLRALLRAADTRRGEITAFAPQAGAIGQRADPRRREEVTLNPNAVDPFDTDAHDFAAALRVQGQPRLRGDRLPTPVLRTVLLRAARFFPM